MKEPLLTADTREPQLFNMGAFIERVNAHAMEAKVEQDYVDAERECLKHIAKLSANREDLRGKVVRDFGFVPDGDFMIVFDDNTFICLTAADLHDSYGVEFNLPSIENATKFGLIPEIFVQKLKEKQAIYEQAKDIKHFTQKSHEVIQQAVEVFGKEKIREILDSL